MHIQEKGRLPSQPEVSNSAKVEGIKVISFTFLNDSSNQTVAISFGVVKCEMSQFRCLLQSKRNRAMILHNMIMITVKALPTYKLVVPYLKCLKYKNLNTIYSKILDVFKHKQINIPQLETIKQVPTFAKILKDMYTIKRCHNV